MCIIIVVAASPVKKGRATRRGKPATPVKKTPVKKTPVKKTPVKKTPVKKTAVAKKAPEAISAPAPEVNVPAPVQEEKG